MTFFYTFFCVIFLLLCAVYGQFVLVLFRRVLVGHRAAVNVVDFDDKYIVSASGDRTIKVIKIKIWSGRAHLSTSCYLNPGLLYTMHTLRFYMILLHDQQNPLTTSNYILYVPKPSCNIQHAKIHEITMTKRNLKRWYS